MDWFAVDEGKMEIVADMFKKDGFDIPSPRCHGKPVTSFDLNLTPDI